MKDKPINGGGATLPLPPFYPYFRRTAGIKIRTGGGETETGCYPPRTPAGGEEGVLPYGAKACP
jgi:hypothetical protein